MSNPCVFTQTTFAKYAKGLLANHDVEFTDEEETSTMFKKGGDHTKLASMAFEGEVGHLSLTSDEGLLGGISLVNEYDPTRKCQTTEIYNYSMACEHLVPTDDE